MNTVAFVLATCLAGAGCVATARAPAPAAETPAQQAGAVQATASGSLRQDEVSLPLQLRGVLVRLLPLHQSVLEVLAPDSYRAMNEQLRFREERIARAAQTHGVSQFSIWYVTFRGLEPEARFSPGELVISASGRDFRPIEIIPLSSGFGQQRIQQGQSQTALYLFDVSLDVQQPLEASMGEVRSTEWSAILRVIERERARLRARRIDTTAAGDDSCGQLSGNGRCAGTW